MTCGSVMNVPGFGLKKNFFRYYTPVDGIGPINIAQMKKSRHVIHDSADK